MTYPLRSFQHLYHVGTMNASLKQSDSQEGNGLSVSLHPNEWQQIAALEGTIFSLTKEKNAFLDAYSLKKHQKEAILTWGEERKYLSPTTLYNVSYKDTEWNQTMIRTFETEEAALHAKQSMEENEEEDIRFYTTSSYTATPFMEKELGMSVPISYVFDFTLTMFAEQKLAIDGVWWNDKLRVSHLSAPKGVINLTSLPSWNITEQ